MIHEPVHPGRFLKETVFDELALDVGQSAKCLCIPSVSLSRVLNGHAAISPDLAIKLEKAGVSRAIFWVRMQAKYDLWNAAKKNAA